MHANFPSMQQAWLQTFVPYQQFTPSASPRGELEAVLPFFKIKQHFFDTLIKRMFFQIMKINNFRGDLSDISANQKPLAGRCLDRVQWLYTFQTKRSSLASIVWNWTLFKNSRDGVDQRMVWRNSVFVSSSEDTASTTSTIVVSVWPFVLAGCPENM